MIESRMPSLNGELILNSIWGKLCRKLAMLKNYKLFSTTKIYDAKQITYCLYIMTSISLSLTKHFDENF